MDGQTYPILGQYIQWFVSFSYFPYEIPCLYKYHLGHTETHLMPGYSLRILRICLIRMFAQ